MDLILRNINLTLIHSGQGWSTVLIGAGGVVFSTVIATENSEQWIKNIFGEKTLEHFKVVYDYTEDVIVGH